MTEEDRKAYRNNADHVIGVIKVDDFTGKAAGVALAPGEITRLNARERKLTAEAPQDAGDNPLANGDLAEITDERETEAAETISAQEVEEQEAAKAAADAEAQREAAAVPPTVPNEEIVAPGSLGGEGAPPQVPDQSAREAAGDGEVPEETAATGDVTGAAVEPTGDAPEGSFATGEEVGTPEAPAAEGEAAGDESEGDADGGDTSNDDSSGNRE